MQLGGELILEEVSGISSTWAASASRANLNPDASFVFYEPEKKRVEWVRYHYPISTVAKKIHEAHLPGYLADRLKAGR